MLAVNLIKVDIKECKFDNETYPSTGDIANLNWSPPLLSQFLEGLFRVEKRIACTMYCQRGKKDTTPPLLFGLGVDQDQTFSSNWLLRPIKAWFVNTTS